METEEYKGYKIEISQDEMDESPREWDNLGTMLCFHKRYRLGDKTDLKSENFVGWSEMEAYLIKVEKAVIILPLYLYDHSGLRMKVGSFNGLLPQGHAEFDSGQVGFVYVTADKLRKEYSVKHITKSVIEKATKVLEGEVENYDQYLCGDVWCFNILRPDGESIDSCGGYYGSEGMLDECKRIIDADYKEQNATIEEHLAEYALKYKGEKEKVK